MAALVQSYPQQSGTVTMLQTRNGSASGMMPQPPSNPQYGAQQPRNFSGMAGGSTAPMTYRGSAAPIQPYAFTSTPNLNPAGQWQQPYPAFRASSSSAVPTQQSFDPNNGYPRTRQTNNSSLPNLPVNTLPGGSRDDSAIPSPATRRGSGTPRPQSAYFSTSTVQTTFTSAAPAKSQPDRYRRPAPRAGDSSSSSQTHSGGSATPSGSGMASVNHLYTPPPNLSRERRPSPSNSSRPTSFTAKSGSVDDMQLYHDAKDSKRIRRRSMPALDHHDIPKSFDALDIRRAEKPVAASSSPKAGKEKDQTKSARLVTGNSPVATANARSGSSESLVSSRSSNSRPSSVSSPTRTYPGSIVQSRRICGPSLLILRMLTND